MDPWGWDDDGWKKCSGVDGRDGEGSVSVDFHNARQARSLSSFDGLFGRPLARNEASDDEPAERRRSRSLRKWCGACMDMESEPGLIEAQQDHNAWND